MKPLEKQKVYKLAQELADRIWNDYAYWNQNIINNEGYNVILSSSKVIENLVEGYNRLARSEKAKHYDEALKAYEETRVSLWRLIRRRIISEQRAGIYSKIIEKLGKNLKSYIRGAA